MNVHSVSIKQNECSFCLSLDRAKRNEYSFRVAATTQTRSEKKASKREAILGAALKLFSDRGFHGTAVPVIAEMAGVGAGTVYRYFASKEAIVNALYQRYKQEIGAMILADLRPDQSPREQFHIYWTRMARFALQNPAAFEFLELHHHSPYLDETSRALEERLVQMAVARFQEFRSERVVKEVDPAILMAIVHGAFVGLIKASNDHGLTLGPGEISQAEQCVWEAMRA